MAHTWTDLLYHIVFSTKERQPFIDDQLKPSLFAYLGGIVRGIGGTALIVNGTADHVHMLMVMPPTVAISDALRTIKTNSSGWIHKKWPDRRRFAWQTGYAAFTVSASNRKLVYDYIAR